jgi:peptide/nickel transport system ATP-binding protein
MRNKVAAMSEFIIQARNLKKSFSIDSGFLAKKQSLVRAVNDVSLNINTGETFGLVGESGCGKSTLGRLLLRLIEPTSGECFFEGRNIYALKAKELRKTREDIQIVFQDPYASLNPKMKIGRIIGEPLRIFNIYQSKQEIESRVKDLMAKVGLSGDHYNRYPHEFSGGQRQRISIARALALNPKLIVYDEAVSALDVSVQAQILNLLKDLQKEFGLTYVFISHDLSVIKYMCDRVGVMYLGRIVELASSKDLFRKPSHPYTQALLSAIPLPNPQTKHERVVLTGDIPNPVAPPEGCAFHPRCNFVMEKCKTIEPTLVTVESEHIASCHLIG